MDNSLPPVHGPSGLAQHDHEMSITRYTQQAETKRLAIKLLACLAAATLIMLAWGFRWEITPVSGGDAIGGAYMLNRWTGSLYYVRFDEYIEVTPSK